MRGLKIWVRTKKIPASILIIAILTGSMVQYFNPKFQLIFLGIIIITLIFGLSELKGDSEQKNKTGVILSGILFVILAASVVIGKTYGNMSENTEGIVLLIAFMEFISSLLIFGYRIVIKSGDSKRIKQFFIGLSIIIGSLILLGLVVLFT